MSKRVYIRVLLQHTYDQYLCSSVYYGIQRSTYCSHSRVHFGVLHVPRVTHPNYPGCTRVSSLSRDELASRVYENPMSWGNNLNFVTHDFAKSPRILNMVMTFVLTPQSHYSSIIEPRAHFSFLSLGMSIYRLSFTYDSVHVGYLSRPCYM